MANGIFHQRAKSVFEKLITKANMSKVFSTLTRKENNLRSYENENLNMSNQHYSGMQTIEIEQIVGSLNRSEDFDANFLPKSSRTKERWMSIAVAMFQDIGLPAIDVYLIGDTYFVEDGHHRVSVAKALGYLYIDAKVIEIESDLNEAA